MTVSGPGAARVALVDDGGTHPAEALDVEPTQARDLRSPGAERNIDETFTELRRNR
ncbi:hypothetical protein ACFVRD_20655 [Streptomyces sp. NPDC057908]|uniref:hypothetical protein n=1 Tax=Streptomyces sp. NPDC057908 TaxID=3346276 RepID=UPI0036EAF181